MVHVYMRIYMYLYFNMVLSTLYKCKIPITNVSLRARETISQMKSYHLETQCASLMTMAHSLLDTSGFSKTSLHSE